MPHPRFPMFSKLSSRQFACSIKTADSLTASSTSSCKLGGEGVVELTPLHVGEVLLLVNIGQHG